MNQSHLIGRLTKDPEYRNTSDGIAVCSFTLAVPKRTDRNKANFISVVTWRGLADNCGKYLKKGSQVGVSGELTSRTYDDKNGSRHYVTEVIADDVEFLTPKEQQEEQPKVTNDPFMVVSTRR